MALPKPLEAAFQEMERRGREACGKIDEAVKALDESGDEIADFDDPSLVRRIEDLRQTTARMKSITDIPVPVDFDDTPVTPLEVPIPIATAPTGTPTPGRRLVRPPRRPPTR